MENREQSSSPRKPQVQSELEPEHRIAAMEHERITGADSPVERDPETGEKPLTNSQRAVIDSHHSGSDTAAMTARESDQLGREKQVVSPKHGDWVRMQVVESGGRLRAALGKVDNVSNLDENRLGENGEPYLTVTWPHADAQSTSGGPDWHKGWMRTSPVHHHTAPSAKAGQESVVWVDLIADADLGEAISLPALELNQKFADSVANAEQQRAAVNNEGYGPVRSSRIAPQHTSATAAVQAGKMTAKAPENTPQTTAAMTTHPLDTRRYPGESTQDELDEHTRRGNLAKQQRTALGTHDTGPAPMEGAATDPGTVGSETIGAAVQGVTHEEDAPHPTGRPFQAEGAAHEHQPE